MFKAYPQSVEIISVNDLAQNVSNSTNCKAASVDDTRQSVKVGGPSVKLHNLSQFVTDRLTFVDRLIRSFLQKKFQQFYVTFFESSEKYPKTFP